MVERNGTFLLVRLVTKMLRYGTFKEDMGDHTDLPPIHMFIHKWSGSPHLYSLAAEHHGTNQYLVSSPTEDRRLSWSG